MKTLASITAIAVLGTIVGLGYAVEAPFDYTATGIEVLDYDLDYETMAVILDVDVSDTSGTLEVTFDREFFDARQLGEDIEFIVIAEGDMVAYNEVRTTQDIRTISFNLNAGVELVEVFGTHLDGFSITTEQTSEQEQAISNLLAQKDELESEKNELAEKVSQLESKNEALKQEKDKLDGKIFDPNNLVSAVGKELNNVGKELNNVGVVITEQFTSFVKWITPK